jgi:imidazolonepropionase-like amidohydrolase
MHAHALNTPDDVDGAYALMLANGVIGFRQMSGSAALLEARASGSLPHPSGAPDLLAAPGELLTPMNASSAAAARATVRQQQAQGADFIKAALVVREAMLAALEEGRRIGIPVAGHLPSTVNPREAAELGMRSIEHLGPGSTVFAAASTREEEVRSATADRAPPIPKVKLPGVDRIVGRLIAGIIVNPAARTSEQSAKALALADATFDEGKAEELAALFVQHDTWHCPTLIRVHTQQFPNAPEHRSDPNRRYMHPDELRRWDRSGKKFATLPGSTRDALEAHWAAQLRLTKVLADGGVGLLAGTDADGATSVIPGFALHDELDLLAAAGLDPVTILRTATTAPARFLGLSDRGVIAPGFRADAVLLRADPFADHRAMREIDGVLRAGEWWSRQALDGVLAAVERTPGAR